MNYTIENECLKVTINSFGAELTSIQTMDGSEYLWQGDPEVWDGQAPNLFPYIGRMTGGKYSYDGKEYAMKIHGIVSYMELEAEEIQKDRIVFRLESSEETYAQYPFEFCYRITYALQGNRICVTNEVENKGQNRMFFGIGGHPGFQVPLEKNLSFEDYVLEFSQDSVPARIGFSEDCFLNGQDETYELEEEKRIPLHHDMFDQDAVILKNVDSCVKLYSPKGSRGVEVYYPDYSIIGFWHMPQMEAPYVCIEPWSSLPSRSGIVENIAMQSDLIKLAPAGIYKNSWEIRIM